jgi:type IX secretion system PorP/SprF family membrane protein
MTGKRFFLIFIAFSFTANSFSQLLLPGLDYQSAMIANPALAGSEGDGKMRLSYQDLYPGNNFNLHSVSVSYDGYFQALHGGAGFYLSDNYLGGLVNDLRGGLSYSYFFRAGTDLYIGAGLSAAFFHRGFNVGEAVLPDQIDPVYGSVNTSSEVLSSERKTLLDIGTGFLFITGKVFGGISVSHLTEPDLSSNEITPNRIYRQISIIGSGEIGLGGKKSLVVKPFGRVEASRITFTASAGASMESEHFSVSAAFIGGKEKYIDLVSGFSISLGNLLVYYNYRFNIAGGETLLPVTVMHNTGLAVSLKNVDKRKIVKTINFPKL